MKLTSQIRLLPDSTQATALLATMKAVNAAATYAAKIGFDLKVYGQVSIHRACYLDVRERFGLPSNIAIRAIAKAVERFARDKTMCPEFQAYGAIPYSDRIYRIVSPQMVSIATIHGRLKVPYIVADYFKGSLSRKMGEADLVYRDGNFYLYVSVEFEVSPPIEANDFLGVDLGIVNIATDSEGKSFSGAKTQRNRRRRATARKQYQRKGTKSAKRRLKQMSGRQRRFQTQENHRISKQLVAKAKALQLGIAMEDLSFIRDRVEATVSRKFRRQFGNWGFAQLRQFVEYKARLAGVPFVAVDPRNTSRTCSACGHCEKANRKSQAEFVCKHCGNSMNADSNAAKNISSLGALCKPPLKVATSTSSKSTAG